MKYNAPHPLHIFLAEDDDDDCYLFKEALATLESDVVITIAKNGMELMQCLETDRQSSPEVLVLDLNMPLKNGYECLNEIRSKSSHFSKLPVVIFTTSSNSSTIEKAYELGASYFAVKPNEFENLKGIINRIVNMNWSSHRKRTAKKDFVLSS